MDLFEFLLKKKAYSILKEAGQDLSLIEPAQDYEMILKGAKFELFCGFRSKKEFVGCEWIDELIGQSEKEGLVSCDTHFTQNNADDTFANINLLSNKFG